MQGFVNQLSQLLIVDRAWLFGAYFVIESVEALIQKSKTPFAHRGARELQVLRDRAVGCLHSTAQRCDSGKLRRHAVQAFRETQMGAQRLANMFPGRVRLYRHVAIAARVPTLVWLCAHKRGCIDIYCAVTSIDRTWVVGRPAFEALTSFPLSRLARVPTCLIGKNRECTKECDSLRRVRPWSLYVNVASPRKIYSTTS